VASVVSFLMTRASRKGIALSDSVSIVNWMEGLKLLKWLIIEQGEFTNMTSSLLTKDVSE
jgi:hypothetical protein